jgi:hypothetical protein
VPVREPVSSLEHDHHYAEHPSAVAPNVSNARGLFLDIADDLVLPTDLSALRPNKGRIPAPHDLLDEAAIPTARSRFHTRTLHKDEVRGLWVIFGLVAGSWLAGGLFKKEPKYAETE